MGKNIPCKWELKEAGVATLTSDKIDLKSKTVTRDKKGHYLMIKESTHQEEIIIVNIHAPNVRAPEYVKQIKHI